MGLGGLELGEEVGFALVERFESSALLGELGLESGGELGLGLGGLELSEKVGFASLELDESIALLSELGI